MGLKHLLVVVAAVAATGAVTRAQTPAQAAPPSIVGAWTLNKDLSELANAQGRGRGDEEGDNGRRGGFGGRRGGGGGFGGGGFGRGGGGAGRGQDREAVQRMRDALRDELRAPDHLTVVDTGSTIIITTQEGRTTRLAANGTKIKDESTGIERRTKWTAGKLVSEISGLGQGKITETYSMEPELKQLRVSIAVDGPRKTSQTRVYDLDR